MAKRKQKLTRFDLGNIVPTSVDVAKPETATQFRERYEREQREAEERPIREAVQAVSKTLAKIHADVADVWRLPIEKLEKFNRADVDALFCDLGLPLHDSTMDTSVADQRLRDAFKQFVESLPSRGWVIDKVGSWRLSAFAQVQGIVGNVEIDVRALQTMFDWLVTHNCFSATDLRYVPELIPPAGPEPEKPLSIDDVLQKGLDGSRNSERLLKRATENDWLKETGALAGEFVDHLQTVWNFRPDDKSWAALFNGPDSWASRMNKNLMDPRTFDEARRYAVSCGMWPAHLRTAQEYLDIQFRKSGDHGVYLRKSNILTHKTLTNRPMNEARDVLGI